MNITFYISGIITIIATLKAITNKNPIYALLYLLLSIISLSIIYFILGSYFAGALEIIIYAGAIMVLFIFVIMILNIKQLENQKKYLSHNKKNKLFITLITLFSLFIIIFYAIFSTNKVAFNIVVSNIKQISIDLFSKYIFAIELCSLLLLSGLIVVIHNKNKLIH